MNNITKLSRTCQRSLRSVTPSLQCITKRFESTVQPWGDWFYQQSSNDPIHRFLKDKAYVNGQWVDSNSGETFDVTDPGSGEVISTLPNMTDDEARDAINISSDAMKKWKALTAQQRCDIVQKMYVLLHSYQEPLARIMTAECGKPLAESRGEVAYTASFFRWFAEEGRRAYGDIIPPNFQNRRILVIKQPVGVCGIITPWNFPGAMIARKVAPGLVAGCSMVIKPASNTPLSALALADIAEEAGVPPGVINIVTCAHENSRKIGTELCHNKIVRKLSFTGSTATGILLAQQSATTMKRISMELGGHAPFIVFDDADVDLAVDGALTSKFRNSGQTCVCTNRFFVHSRIYNEFVEKFAKRVQSINVGHGFYDNIQQGPMINEAGLLKADEHVQDAVSKGAEVVFGGKRKEVSGLNGAFYEPTVLANVNRDAEITYEETFGPVAPIYSFDDDDDIVGYANDSDMGLASYFYTRDLKRAFRVSEQLEYGMVGVNSGLISAEIAPFGGIKFSGVGKEGSKYGLDEYLNTKYICMDNM